SEGCTTEARDRHAGVGGMSVCLIGSEMTGLSRSGRSAAIAGRQRTICQMWWAWRYQRTKRGASTTAAAAAAAAPRAVSATETMDMTTSLQVLVLPNTGSGAMLSGAMLSVHHRTGAVPGEGDDGPDRGGEGPGHSLRM